MSHVKTNYRGLYWSAILALSYLMVLGAIPASATGWHTNGSQIVDGAGKVWAIAGVAWYGAQSRKAEPGGLWTQPYTVILNEIKLYGFNTVRIPISNQNWETDPVANGNPPFRDLLANILNYAGSIGLHVIIDDHNVSNNSGITPLWYNGSYTEQVLINDWVHILDWTHGVIQPGDSVAVNYLASDGDPEVLAFDLKNEPHTDCSASGCKYTISSMWGSGDGISPATNPNPNPFSPACVSSSTCTDWRLGAERMGDSMLGEAAVHGWDWPLIAVEGIQVCPTSSGSWPDGPFIWDWWGGNLACVNGNSANPGAPIVLNAGGDASSLGPAVNNQVVYSAHDYGPALNGQSWFNASTCYAKGCSSSSLADVWHQFWSYINEGEVNPTWPGHSGYPWSNTGATAYTSAPVWIGEFGTPNSSTTDLYSTGNGSEGQWFTDMVNFIYSSYTHSGNSGYNVSDLQFTYWAINGNDSMGILNTSWTGLAEPAMVYSFLCYDQQPPFALSFGSGSNQCSSTGTLPTPQ